MVTILDNICIGVYFYNYMIYTFNFVVLIPIFIRILQFFDKNYIATKILESRLYHYINTYSKNI